MNQDELDQILRSSRLPERPESYWDGFPERVSRRLEFGSQVPIRSRPWLLAAALACAVAFGIFLGLFVWHRISPPDDRLIALYDGRVLREMQAQYPGRLQAIIQDGSGVHTQLSQSADVSMSHPVLLEIRDGRDHRVIVTFSGQIVQCGGRNVMVLSDVGGQVMLVGEGLFWSRETSTGLSEAVQIQAEQIPNARARVEPPTPL
jgi:hypothetical protein